MKTLIRELPFGKAVAKVKVSMFRDEYSVASSSIITSATVEIIAGDKVVSKGYFAKVKSYNFITKDFYERYKLDVNKKYSTVGDKAVTEGEEAGNAINAAIEEMEEELAKEFGVETEASKRKRLQKEEDAAIIEQAEKDGVENLMTEREISVWRDQYNNLHNEGGEGYIPTKISKEAYLSAKERANQ